MPLRSIREVSIHGENNDIMGAIGEKLDQLTPGSRKNWPVIEAHTPRHALLYARKQASQSPKRSAVKRAHAHHIFREADQWWQEHWHRRNEQRCRCIMALEPGLKFAHLLAGHNSCRRAALICYAPHCR